MSKISVIIKIILSIFIIYAFYLIAKYYYNKEEDATQKVLLNKSTTFTEDFIKVVNRNDIFPPSVNFSLSWRMRIANVPSNFLWNSSFEENKPIILNGGCPDIYYKPSENQLNIQFSMLNSQLATLFKEIIINDIPVQSWITIAIIVKSRVTYIYINGKLKYSVMLPTIPIQPEGNLKMGEVNHNFLGKINDVVYHNYPLNMNQIEYLK